MDLVDERGRDKSLDNRKRQRSLATMAFGLLRVAVGIFGIWGQFALAEKGTHYGFCWPDSFHKAWINLRTVNLFIFSLWFIYTGIWGMPTERRAVSTLTNE